ncbi:hypothetical protein DFR70_10243 [Nocardia tenerifensis]|uniref:DUF3551 domain-containing protein n=1 Tax=Nocardia tenerifensis TaxID=228006 RepID=A0A318K651_9NOCA|nr:hypothetical protein [Nocardia tenerifensis]PXX68363.1 hypothetical protein DFR70_10243 [Nocardia tenerifensis]
MLERSAAALTLAVALALPASALARADPAPAYYPTLDTCLAAMSKYKTGPAQCTYIDAIGAYELRVPGG